MRIKHTEGPAIKTPYCITGSSITPSGGTMIFIYILVYKYIFKINDTITHAVCKNRHYTHHFSFTMREVC